MSIKKSAVLFSFLAVAVVGVLAVPALSHAQVATSSATQPILTVLSPNGGETWIAGTTSTISWTRSDYLNGTFVTAAIYLVSATGTNINYNFVAQTQTQPDRTASWSWTPPINLAGTFKVRICGFPPETSYCDISDRTFNILPATTPILTVLSPNGGEIWTQGTLQQIRWSPQGFPTNSSVYISLYGPTTSTIATNVLNSGSYSWTIPSDIPSSSNYRVYIWAGISGASYFDYSDAPFTITSTTSTPTPTSTQPTAIFTIEGQDSYTYNVGQINHFRWDSSNADIFSSYSVANNPTKCGQGVWVANTARGESRTYLGPDWAGCVWNLTYTARNSTTGQSASKTVTVTVNPLTTAPSITVIAPNGGELWQKGTYQTIKWQENTTTMSCPVGAVCIPPEPKYYDIKLAPSYPPCIGTICPLYPSIAPYTIATGVYGTESSWYVGKIVNIYGGGDTAPDGSYTVQVCQSGTNTCDSSNASFKIYSSTTQPSIQPSITVLSPDGGDSWQKGSMQTITWNTLNTVPSVYIGIRKSGVLKYSVASRPVLASKGSYTFKLPTFIATGVDYKVRITNSQNKLIYDESNAPFSIVSATQPSITVLSPNGGESWQKGTTQTIKWQDNTTYPPCVVGAPCVIPAPKYYNLKLAPYYPPCTGTICPVYPYVAPYKIATRVHGAESSWYVGQIVNIYGDGDTAPDGSYTVQVCQTGTNRCDSSDAPFTITSVTTQPSTKTLIIIKTGSGKVTGNGINCGTLWNQTDCSETFSATTNVTLTAIPTFNYLFLGWMSIPACSGTGTCIVSMDVSKTVTANFVFSPPIRISSITVNSPNGGEDWTKGTTQMITWQSSIVFSSVPIRFNLSLVPYCAPGQICPTFVLASNVATGSYQWTVGQTSGGTAPDGSYAVKICRTGTTTCDTSNSYFKITSGTATQPSITVLSPNGGEYKAGEDFTTSTTTSSVQSADLNQMANVLESIRALLDQIQKILSAR